MLNKLLLILACSMRLSANCAKGCLKCDPNNNCLVCDISRFYILENNACVQAPSENIQNCALIDFNGVCIVCTPGMNLYLPTSTNKCTSVDTNIENCYTYDSVQSCNQCNSGFRLDAGSCVAVTTSIANCEVHNSETTCSVCAGGYYLNTDNTGCVALPTIQNCLYVSKYQCETCDANYILNYNLQLTSLLQVSNDAQKNIVLGLLASDAANQTGFVNYPVCQEIKIENCITHLDFQNCSECASTHFLSADNKCILNPVDRIPNCQNYSSNTVCTSCEQGYLLTNSTTCSKITSEQAKANCTLHDPSVSNVVCTKCANNYILSNNSCTERQNLVENCALQGQSKDNHCEQCNTGYVLNNTSTICGPIVDNCLVHEDVTVDSSACNTCVEGYYLNENVTPAVCSKGTQDNCQSYERNLDQCVTCVAGYFLNSANICIQHVNVTNCASYSGTDRDQCLECNEDYYPFIINEVCVEKPVVFFCAAYDLDEENGTSTCSQCEDGKKLVVNPTSKCEDITIDNCLNVSGGDLCTKCEVGYGRNELDAVHSCESVPVWITQNCSLLPNQTGETGQFFEVNCTNCGQNAFAVNVQNVNVCWEDDKWNKLPGSTNKTKITNCIAYNEAYECILCDEGYYLQDDDGTCLNTCDGVIQYFSNVNDNSAPNVNICVAAQNFVTAQTLLSDNNQGIVECTNNLRIVDIDAPLYHNLDVATGKVLKPFHYEPGLSECIDFVSGTTEVNLTQQTTSSINNFRYIYDDNGDYMAKSCALGKTSNEANLGDCSATMTDCNTSMIYEFAPDDTLYKYLSFLSCHACTGNKTPVLAYETENGIAEDFAFLSYSQFSLDEQDWDSANKHNHNFCVDFGQSQTNLNAVFGSANDVNTIDNCGHYALARPTGVDGTAFDNSDASVSNSDTNVTNMLFCMYCKPGFRPTMNEAGNKVISCTEIQNCDAANSTMANGCNKCATNTYHPFDGGIDYTADCVAVDNNNTQSPNCVAVDVDDMFCQLCEAGYVLNEDNNCVSRTYPNCEDSMWREYYTTLKDDVPQIFQVYGNNGQSVNGCSKCKSGFFSLRNTFNDTPNYTCFVDSFGLSTKGTFSQTIEQTPVDSAYVDNCQYYENYGNVTLPKCAQCNDGYLLAVQGNDSKCYATGDNTNCKTLGGNQTNADCSECMAGFGLVPGNNGTSICSKVSIANCMTYNTDTQRPTVQCEACDDGFALIDNACVAGMITNCKRYDSNKYLCTECQTGHILIEDSKLENNQFAGVATDNFQRSYCIKSDDMLNCSVATLNGNNELECTTCQEASYLKKTLTPPDNNASNDLNNVCLNYHTIENCNEYLLGSNLGATNFSCVECENMTHYRSENGFSCTQRTILDPNAKEYQISADLISECHQNYFVSANQKECMPYPDGIIGCIRYENQNTCLACNDTRYLENNECKLVTDKVSNCMSYSADLICSACKANFYLNKLDAVNDKGHTHECVTAITNCLLQSTSTLCSKCQAGFNLNTEKTQCTASTKLNCSVFEADSDNCMICNQNFFKQADGTCASVPTEKRIANCLQQASETTCQLCDKGFALQEDGLKCNESTLDANCLVQSEPTAGNCSLCDGGYQFNQEGVCEALTGVQSYSSGCFISLPGPNTEICYLCRSNYHMKIDQSCSMDVDNTNTGGNTGTEGVEILKQILYIALLMFF